MPCEPNAVPEKIRLGISTCLLGKNVRYDGGHKLDRYIRDTLGQYFDWHPICPEAAAGFGIPREAVHLVGDPEHPRLMTVRSKKDLTDKMLAFSKKKITRLADEHLCGYIFKTKSPSSGMERIKVYNEKGNPTGQSSGIFAKQFMLAFPDIPVIDEGRLHDINLRENFIERVFGYARLQHLWQQPYRRGAIVEFHSRQKLLIMSHSPKHYQAMGKLVASIKTLSKNDFVNAYTSAYLEALKHPATVKKHTNVLQHIMGYFKKELDQKDKQYLLGVINDYHQGLIPLIVPITLLKQYINKFDIDYLCRQVYLQPHPKELMLRNHV